MGVIRAIMFVLWDKRFQIEKNIDKNTASGTFYLEQKADILWHDIFHYQTITTRAGCKTL